MLARRGGGTMRARLAGFALLLACSPALGAEGKRYGLDYVAPPACPDAWSFAMRVSERALAAQLAEGGEGEARLVVRIEASEKGFVADLLLQAGAEEPTTRRVTGSDCDELVDALVVVGALALDAQEPLAQAERPEPTPQDAAEPAPTRADISALPRSTGWIEPEFPEPRGLGRQRFSWAGVGAALATGFSPRVAPGARVFAELGAVSHLDFRVEVGAAAAGRSKISGEEARFALFDFSAGACTLLGRARWHLASPCLTLELGMLRSTGFRSEDVDDPRTGTAPWAALGLGGRLALGVGRRTALILGGGLSAPLTRPAFVVEVPERRELFKPAPVGMRFVVGVARTSDQARTR